jgi:hypothetical protein
MSNLTPEQTQELVNAVQSITSLHEQIQSLTAQLQSSISRGNTQAHQIQQLTQRSGSDDVKASTYRVQPPENYDGVRKDLPKFFTQLELVFRSGPVQFATEEARIIYACTFLRGTAYAWVQPHLEVANDPILTTWENFKTALQSAFGDPDLQATAERQLSVLKQTGATSAYAAEFRRLAALAKWDKQALNFHFYNGLKDSVKDELARDDRPTDLDVLISKSIRIDDRHYERAKEKKGSSFGRNTNVPITPTSNDGMDIDALGVVRKLTPAEKKRRYDLDLCLYCGGEGHKAHECTEKNKNKPAVKSYSESKILLPVYIDDHVPSIIALGDTGGEGNFINEDLAMKLKMPTEAIEAIALSAALVNNQEQPLITRVTKPIKMRIGNHVENIRFYLAPIKYQVIIGLPWFRLHNPKVNFSDLTISLNQCKNNCTKQNNHRIAPKISLINAAALEMLARQNGNEIYSVRMHNLATRVGEIDLNHLEIDDSSKPKVVLPDVYKEFSDVFTEKDNPLPENRPYDHTIPLQPGTKPPTLPVYGLNEKELKECWKYLQENLDKGFIRKSSAPCGAPILFVKKKDGSLRLCVDYRGLNKITIKNKYPLPLITELLDRLKNAKVYTVLDLLGAYNLLRIKPGEEWKTAFRTRYGLYEYCVMPFGLCNAPASFQEFINDVLGDLLDDSVSAYLDDILIFSTDVEKHEAQVKEVLRRLRKYGLVVKLEKCIFSAKEVPYLGFIVGPGYVRMDPTKVASVVEWPTPTSVLEIQIFLGFANFYRRFIRSFSKIAKPITKLLKKEEKFHWGAEQQSAFDQLKELFISSPVIHTFERERETVLETDASDFALGAVLSQVSNGKLYPIAYHSRSFVPAEQNYEVHDKELLAIVDSLKEFRHYLQATERPFLILTDHKNLEYFHTTKILNARQINWSQLLATYNFQLSYRPGKFNPRADAMSRRPDYLKEIDPEKFYHSMFQPQHRFVEPDELLPSETIDINALTTISTSSDILDNIRAAYEEDELALKHIEDVRNNLASEPLTVRQDLLYFGTKLYIPDRLALKLQILSIHHDSLSAGHFGQAKTYELVDRQFYWPGMRKFINEYISSCDTCNRSKSIKHLPYGPLTPLPIAEKPWSSISLDFIVDLPVSKTFDSILVVVDRLTKYATFIPTNKTITADQFCDLFIAYIFAQHGMPHEIISDRGSIFTSKFWQRFCDLVKVKTNLSTAFHPQSDGQTERVNQVVEQYIRVFGNYQQNDWTSLLPLAQFTYNNSQHSSIGTTPFYANYGYHPETHFTSDQLSQVPKAEERIKHLKETQEHLKINLQRAIADYKLYYDQDKKKPPSFQTNDNVWLVHHQVRGTRPSRKLDNKRLGPYKIIRKLSNNTYKLKLPASMRIHPVFHVSHLEQHKANQFPGRIKPRSPPVVVNAEEEYEVERVLDSRIFRSKLQYLVKWEGWDTSENTWRPKNDLRNCQRLVEEFHRDNPNKPQ